ncbi:hypothetical protein CCACVL1_00788, partial [Corchorus capsularis]
IWKRGPFNLCLSISLVPRVSFHRGIEQFGSSQGS